MTKGRRAESFPAWQTSSWARSPILIPLGRLASRFSLFHFTTSYLFLLVAPGLSEVLGFSEAWSQECYSAFIHYGTRPGHFRHSLPPTLIPMPGGHLRLALCPGPMKQVWWSSQVLSSPSSLEWFLARVVCLCLTPAQCHSRSQAGFF